MALVKNLHMAANVIGLLAVALVECIRNIRRKV